MSSSQPTPVSVDEINRIVSGGSLRKSVTTEFVNERVHSPEKPPETPTLPLEVK